MKLQDATRPVGLVVFNPYILILNYLRTNSYKYSVLFGLPYPYSPKSSVVLFLTLPSTLDNLGSTIEGTVSDMSLAG